jgi:pimeloyl-ACP methyl ester carboxylesterase
MPQIAIDGRIVDYQEHGTGNPPLVFVHGGFGSSSDLWRETIERLPPRHRSYAIDNFLRSEPPPSGYSVQSFATRLVGFIRALRLARPVVIGHSMGGVVCLLAMMQAPEEIGGGVLIGSGASTRNHIIAQRLLDDMRGGLSTEQIREISRLWFAHAPEAFFERYVANAVQAPREAMVAVQESLIATDIEDRLTEIACPVLIVHGLLDTGRTLEHAEALQRGIRDCSLMLSETSGHSPMVDAPEEFDRAFHAFLRKVQSPWPDGAAAQGGSTTGAAIDNRRLCR